MIDKLRDASKIILIPGLVLYVFGFICITSYLGRFGVVSFDIINSRFIIAGFYPLVSLAVVLYLSWMLYVELPLNKWFDTVGWRSRLKSHLKFLILIFAATAVLVGLMSLGAYKPPAGEQVLKFAPIFKDYDFIGQQLMRFHLNMPAILDFMTRSTLYLFFYLMLLVLLFVLGQIVYGWIPRTSREKKISAETPSRLSVLETDVKELSKTSEYKRLFSFLVFSLNLLITCLYLVLLSYSYLKLRVQLFDFQSFGKLYQVTQGLLFAWAFSSVSVIYLFLNNTEIPTTQLALNWSKQFTNYGNLQWTTHQLIVPVLASLFFFGAAIFPRIPFSIGGGEPRAVKVTMSNSQQSFGNGNSFLIGESSQFFFIVDIGHDKDRALEINKDMVAYLETKVVEK